MAGSNSPRRCTLHDPHSENDKHQQTSNSSHYDFLQYVMISEVNYGWERESFELKERILCPALPGHKEGKTYRFT
jgi:hypothetical protein